MRRNLSTAPVLSLPAKRSASTLTVPTDKKRLTPLASSIDKQDATLHQSKKPITAWQQTFTTVDKDKSNIRKLSSLVAASMPSEDIDVGENTLKRKANVIIDSRRARHVPTSEIELTTLRTERLFPMVPRLEGLQVHYTDTSYNQYLLLRSPGDASRQLSAAETYLLTLAGGGDGVAESIRKARVEYLKGTHKAFSDEVLQELGASPSNGNADLFLVPLSLEPLPQSDRQLLLKKLCECRGLVYEPTADDVVPTMTSIQKFIGSGTCPPASLADVADIYDQGAQFTSSGWAFVVYTENIPSNAAVEFLSSRLGVPNTAIRAMTPTSKQSTGLTFFCILPNYVKREHLLMINVMTFPGFVMKVGSITAIPDELFADSEVLSKIEKWNKFAQKHERTFVEDVNPQYSEADRLVATGEETVCDEEKLELGALLDNSSGIGTATANIFPEKAFVSVTKLFRRVQGGSRADIEQSLEWLRLAGSINYKRVPAANILTSAKALLNDDIKKSFLSLLFDRASPALLKNFIVHPTVANAVAAKSLRLLSEPDTLLKNFILTQGDYSECLTRISKHSRSRISSSIANFIYNGHVSARLRLNNTKVLVGDFVVKRSDEISDHSQRVNEAEDNTSFARFSGEQVHLITSEEEASQYSISDVVIPSRPIRPANLTQDLAFMTSFAPSNSPCSVNTKEWLIGFVAMHGIPAAYATNNLSESVQRALGVYEYSHSGKRPPPITYHRMISTPFKMKYEIYEDDVQWAIKHSQSTSTTPEVVEKAEDDLAFTSEGFSLLDEAPSAMKARMNQSSLAGVAHKDESSLLHLRGTPLNVHQRMYDDHLGSVPMGIQSWSGQGFMSSDSLRFLSSASQAEELSRCLDAIPKDNSASELPKVGALFPAHSVFGLPDVIEDRTNSKDPSVPNKNNGKEPSFMVWGTSKRRSESFVSATPITDSDALSAHTKNYTVKITFFQPPGTSPPETLLESYLATGRISTTKDNGYQHNTNGIIKVANASLLRSVATKTEDEQLFDLICKELYTRIVLDKNTGKEGRKTRVLVRSPAPAAKDQFRQMMLNDLKTWRLDESAAPLKYSTLMKKTACDICFLADHTSSEQCAKFKYHKNRRREKKMAGIDHTLQRTAQIREEKQRNYAQLESRGQQHPALATSSADSVHLSQSTAMVPRKVRGPIVAEWNVIIDREDTSVPWGFFATGMHLTRISLSEGSERIYTVYRSPGGQSIDDSSVVPKSFNGQSFSVTKFSEELSKAKVAGDANRTFIISEVNGMPVSDPETLVATVRNNVKVLDYESDPETRLRLTVVEYEMVSADVPSPVSTSPETKKSEKQSEGTVPPRVEERTSTANSKPKATKGPDIHCLVPASMATSFDIQQTPTRVNFIRRTKDERWGLNAQGLRVMPSARSMEEGGVAKASSQNKVLTEILLTDATTAGGKHLFEVPSTLPAAPSTTSIASNKRSSNADGVIRQNLSANIMTDTIFVVRGINNIRIENTDTMHKLMTTIGKKVLRLSVICDQVLLPLIHIELNNTKNQSTIGFSLSSKGRLAALTSDNSVFGDALLQQAPMWCNLRPDFTSKLKSYDNQSSEELLDDDDIESVADILQKKLLFDKKGLASVKWRVEAVNGIPNFDMRSLKEEMERLKTGAGTVKLSLRMLVPVGE